MKKQAITYGKYTNDQWETINGLESVSYIIQRLKDEIKWKGYQLWVHGSILSNCDTNDIDLTIMGPMIPQRINQLLEEVVKIGFEEQIYCDVKYNITNELWDAEKDSVKTIRQACYRPEILFDGQLVRYAEVIGGLYLKEEQFPTSKMINAKSKGRVYKSPLRLI